MVGTYKKMLIALMVSVALNLFLVGLVTAPLLGGRLGPHGFGPPPPEFMLERLAGRLPPEDAAILRKIFNAETGGLRDSHMALRGQMEALKQAMIVEKPDPAVLKKILDEIDAASGLMHQSMSATMLRLAAELPWASRKKLAEAMEEGPGGRWGPPGP